MKILFFILFFISATFALDITPKSVPVYKKIEVSYDLKDINLAIKKQHKFKKIQHFVRLFQNKSHENLWIKIPLVNSSKNILERVFITRWDRVNFELFTVKNGKVIFSENITNNNYIRKSSPITILAGDKVDFYIKVKAKKALDQFFYIYFVDKNKADKFIIKNEKLYHYGLFFGILLTMTMYSYFMYFSIKEKAYLFLAFYQTSVLIATSDLRQHLFVLLENMPTLADFMLRGFVGYIIMLLSILFTKEIFNTKKEMPHFNILLNILIIVLLPLNQIHSNINYASFLYIIYVFAGIYVFFEKKNPLAFFYTLAFLGFPLHLVSLNLSILFDWNFYFEYPYAKQVFTCIESFALAMALYLKIDSLVKEKTKATQDVIKNEKLMLEQSRFASMGEMLASIAHQWRQPLNHINIIMANLQLAFESGKLNKEYMEKKALETDNQLKYMSTTIESFSTFFATKEQKEEFHLTEVCKYTISLVESRLKKHKVTILLTSNDECAHINYKNELTQVLLIVLNNAIDALISNNIENKKIEVIAINDKITVQDNAGGIKEEILHKIFDPYFSTKDKKFGSGLGLYTSKIIIDNLIKGKIEAKNIKDGASFNIYIP